MKALAQVVVRTGQHGCAKLTALSRKPKLHCCSSEMFSYPQEPLKFSRFRTSEGALTSQH